MLQNEPAKVSKRGQVYQARYRVMGVLYRKSTGSHHVVEAQEIADKMYNDQLALETKIDKGETNDMWLSDALDTTEMEHYRGTKNHGQIKTQVAVLTELMPDVRCSEVDDKFFKKLKRLLRTERNLGNKTINRYFSLVNQTLKYVREEYDVECLNGVSGVRLPEKGNRVRVIDEQEEAKVIKWFKEYHAPQAEWNATDLVEIFEVMVKTGMRRGEVFSFRVESLRKSGRAIEFTAEEVKSNKTESVVLSKYVAELIQARIKREGLKGSDRVFPYNARQFTRLWSRLRNDIGLKNDKEFVPHCCRHTFASRLACRGASIYDVSKLLRHSSISVTEKYAHLFTDHLEDTVALLD